MPQPGCSCRNWTLLLRVCRAHSSHPAGAFGWRTRIFSGRGALWRHSVKLSAAQVKSCQPWFLRACVQTGVSTEYAAIFNTWREKSKFCSSHLLAASGLQFHLDPTKIQIHRNRCKNTRMLWETENFQNLLTSPTSYEETCILLGSPQPYTSPPLPEPNIPLVPWNRTVLSFSSPPPAKYSHPKCWIRKRRLQTTLFMPANFPPWAVILVRSCKLSRSRLQQS